jgi:SEC-C motif
MFENQLEEIIEKYPKLYKFTSNNILILKGFIDVIDNNGKVWDTFEIEIHPIDKFPNAFPILFEIGGKIPRNSDWHIYDNGSCCLTVPPNETIVCKNGITVLEFIDEWVLPYLANQVYRNLTGNFANGEYSHGVLGIIEFYEKLLVTKNENEIVKILYFILKENKPKRTNICFCGSRKKFRHCHKDVFEKTILIGEDMLRTNLVSMMIYWNMIPL